MKMKSRTKKNLLLSICNFKCCNVFSGKFKWQINPRNQAAHSLSNKNISSHFERRGSALHALSRSPPPRIRSIFLAFHSYFTSFIGRIPSHSFAHSVFPHYLCLIHLLCSLFYTLNWDEKPKTEDKNGRVFFSFIQIATRKINLCVCTMYMFLIILHVSREWQQMQRGRVSGWANLPKIKFKRVIFYMLPVFVCV